MDTQIELYVIGNNKLLYDDLMSNIGPEHQLRPIELDAISKYEIEIGIILRSAEDNTMDLIQQITSEFPDSTFFFVDDKRDFDLLRDAIRLGVADYFLLPEDTGSLKERLDLAVENLKEKDKGNGSDGGFKRGKGELIAFYSGKGGAGKSLLSSTFAQTLRLESTAKVLFIDLNLQFGGAETFLGLDTKRSIIDLLPVRMELNEHHLRNIAEKEEHSNLHVVVSPRDSELAEKVDEDFIIRLMRACKRSYDFIIVDLPSAVDERVYACLEEADRILYVMNLDTVSIRVLKTVEELFQKLGLPTEERLELVHNKIGKDTELTKKDVERFVTYKTAAEIRKDGKGVQTKVNQGEPLRKEAKEKKLTPVAKDVQKWVRSMLK